MTRFALRGLVRAPFRAIIRVLVLAAAAGLLGAMVLFVGHSLRTMTAGAVRSVPLDWQGPVGSATAATNLATAIAKQPGVIEAQPVATAPFAGIEHKTAVGRISSGAGALLAVPPEYLDHIRTFRFLRGGLKAGELVLDQQLAATLQAKPGDLLTLTPRRGAKPVRLRVGGIALVSAADVLFQPLNPLSGPAPAQPPADIAIVPIGTFATRIATELPALSAAATPATAALPGAPVGVQWQVHAQLDPHALTGSPSHALVQAAGIRNRIERTFPGRVQFVDNLSDALNSAAGDALYAETLYIMLAVPGALIALGLAYLAALGTIERDRRDIALLRGRGASRRDLTVVALSESGAIGLVAGLLGAGVAIAALRLLVKGGLGLSLGLVAAALVTCIALATTGALIARLGAAARRPDDKPLWQRLYLDLIALAVSGFVYWLTARTGFSAVVNPDSNPTLSLSVYMFLAPALLWVGAALLLLRLRGRAFTALARGRAQTRRGFLIQSAARRGASLNRGLLLLGLLLAFGVEVGVFAATYDQQARIDAELTLGADVVAQGQTLAAQRLRSVPGVTAVSGVDHAYAYVGPDLQDMFGVNPNTIGRATTLRSSYFLGGSAHDQLARLRLRRDAVLVSKETITDYSLNLGDLLKLRLLDRRTGRFRVVPFHVTGIVQEFPSAPRDSFMVGNLSYLLAATHDRGTNVVFIKASGDPASVARSVSAAVPAASVKNISQQSVQTVSSITTVDLTGISRIEEAFAIALAAASMVLYATVALAERRRELAAMAALGSSVRELAAFIWTEIALVVLGGAALAAFLGWLLAEMLVAMLQHVFDPPPDHLAAPWHFLVALGGAALIAALAGGLVAQRSVGRLQLGAILREE